MFKIDSNSVSEKVFLQKGAEFINENQDLIKSVHKVLPYNDDPKLYHYIAYLDEDLNSTEPAVASGCSFKKHVALLRLLGETVERCSLSLVDGRAFVYKSFEELQKGGFMAINPSDIFCFSTSQLKKLKISPKDFGKVRIRWVEGNYLLNGSPVFIPAQLVFVPYPYFDSEPILRLPTSTGAATGLSREDSLRRGICEVLERDAFAISYMNKLKLPKIDLSRVKDNYLLMILGSLKRYNYEVYVMDSTMDIGIPSVIAIIVDRSGKGPAVSVGLKAGLDCTQIVSAAIEEAMMSISWERDKFLFLDKNPKSFTGEVRSFEDRARYWFPTSVIDKLDFWLSSSRISLLDARMFLKPRDDYEVISRMLGDFLNGAIYVDLADKLIKSYGFCVTKVIIPDLVPLHLMEKYAYLGHERLYTAPVKMGLIDKPKKEADLNKVPHPLL